MAKIKERFTENGICEVLIIPENTREIGLIRKMGRMGIGGPCFNSDYATGQNRGELLRFTPRKRIRCKKCGEYHTRYYCRSDVEEVKQEP